MDQLAFSPLLKNVKRIWNTSQSRYVSFYDAQNPLKKMLLQKLNWENTEQVRTRLILALRFIMLCRSIDLERMFRTVSMIGSKPFILLQRKGIRQPQWESLVTLPKTPEICPWQLLQKYVRMTHNQVPPGAPLFISLKPPFIALKANSLGSLTRRALAQLGVNTSVWKPHSTRGAGVTMLKQLGLSSEEVCEIGKWKNVAAFTSHYLRLEASTKVGGQITANGAQSLTIGKC